MLAIIIHVQLILKKKISEDIIYISVKGWQNKFKKLKLNSDMALLKKRKLQLFSLFVVKMRKTKSPPNDE